MSEPTQTHQPPPRGRTSELVDLARRQVEHVAELLTDEGLVLAPPTTGPRDEASTAAQDWLPGYQIVHEIRRGGQGVVYKAVQTATKRTVALKVLLAGSNSSGMQRVRFEREIDLAASLRHPNIATVYDSGSADGRYYYAMEYIHGQPLTAYLRDKNLKLNELLRLFQRICSAISYAHQKGIIHRDLKPGNILVDGNGEPHIVDFGLAKIAGSHAADAPVTLTGEFLGTLAYASPEQTKGDPDLIDVRSDVYSLGVVLYEMLTGQYPYPVAGAMMDVLKAISESQPLPPSSWFKHSRSRSGGSAQRVNHEIETIVMKCLRKERERRYQSAGELASDIQRYLAGDAIEAKRDNALYVLRKLAVRNLRATLVLALLLVILASCAGISGYLYRDAVQAKLETAWIAREAARQLDGHTSGARAERGLMSALAFGWFLNEWHAGRSDYARAIREQWFHGVPDYDAAAAFLLDERLGPDSPTQKTFTEVPGLRMFAIGERHLHDRQFQQAHAAFESCVSVGNTWFARAARARLHQLDRQDWQAAERESGE